MARNEESIDVNKGGRAAGAGASAGFREHGARDVRDLVEGYPLAWVIGGGGREACLLPLVGVFDPEDRLVELIGHFARTNPLGGVFTGDPAATILFKGPDGYISPSNVGRRDWGPTWNYAQARVRANVTVAADLTADAVDRLVEHVERGRPAPWSAAELGERYRPLLQRIIGFRARVTHVDATFKLGQTETMDDFESIVTSLADEELVRWMRRFEPCSTC